MELYVLDSLFRRATVVDTFDSCVWTERYNDVGDLTLNIHSTLGNRNLFTPGTYLAMNRSRRVMKIDTVEDKRSSDGTQTLVCTGSSIENMMAERPARDSVSVGLTAEPKWIITGLPAAIARQLFQNIMVDAVLDPGDALPFYTVGNAYPADGIPEPDVTVSLSLDPTDLLSALKTICQTYDLGFRITRNADTSQMFFNVYSGNDRTSSQTVNAPVIFAPVLDNLLNSSYLTSTKQYRNVAYVFGADAAAKVYDTGIDPGTAGFVRRVLPVTASDLKYPDRSTAGVGGTPAYTVTMAQQTAVKAVQSLTSITTFQHDSLQKILNLTRILPQDDVNITTALGVVFALVGTQAASILSAQSVAGVTTDQKNALIDLGNLLRLTSAEVSSLNTLLSNNTSLTSTQKTDITAAANLQNTTVMPGEVTLITAAVTTSHAYDATEDAAYTALLTARGLQELAKNNNITAFDGEIPQFGSYVYDLDYFLGDLTEMRNIDGIVNQVRVSEQIFSQDANGEKSYPTLASRLVITPGVWGAWDANQNWADVDDGEHWGDLS